MGRGTRLRLTHAAGMLVWGRRSLRRSPSRLLRMMIGRPRSDGLRRKESWRRPESALVPLVGGDPLGETPVGLRVHMLVRAKP